MAADAFLDEIRDQPRALRRLIDYYAGPEGQGRLAALPAPQLPAFAGMGASHHGALIAAHWLRRGGLPAFALESVDLVQEPGGLAEHLAPLVYVSQSGASAEVRPLLELFAGGPLLVAVTNEPGSPLAQGAPIVLPLHAGAETTVATKTYLNSLAVLWLVTEGWQRRSGPALEALWVVADALDSQIAQAEAIAAGWLEQLAAPETLLFVGHGLHAVTARQAAMMVMEWVKTPALSSSIGAFRHGPIEFAQPGQALVIFAGLGARQASALRLADEARGYGMQVRVVEAGLTHQPGRDRASPPAIDPRLAPMLDIVPVQLFVEALARRRGVAAGFRHIRKIVDRL